MLLVKKSKLVHFLVQCFNKIFSCRKFSYLILRRNLDDIEPRKLVSNDITFRRLIANDIPQIISLYPNEFGLLLKKRVTRRINRYCQNGFDCFLACYGNQILGFFWAIPWSPSISWLTADDAFEISNLFVIPEYRGSGMAEQLLHFGLYEMSLRGFKEAFSKIHQKRTRSIRVHLKCDFECVTVLEVRKFFRLRLYATSNRYREEWKIEKKLPSSILIGNDSSNILTQARELGSKGIKIYHLYSDWAHALSMSRFVNQSIHVTAWNANQLSQVIQKIAERHDRSPVIYFETERDIPMLAKIEKRIGQKVLFVNSPSQCIEFISKQKQQQLAERSGFSIAETCYIDSSTDLNVALNKLSYPILCRPESPTARGTKFKAKVFYNQTEAVDQLRPLLEGGNRIIAQTYIKGKDSDIWFFICVCNNNGETIAETVGHKLIQFPPGAGIMAAGVSCWNSSFTNISRRYFKQLKLRGPMGLEAKYDRTTNKFYFIEINLRTENINGISSKEVPISWIAFKEVYGHGPLKGGRVRCSPGRVWIHGVKALFSVSKGPNSLSRIVSIFSLYSRKKTAWAFFDRKDFGPFWGHIVLCIKKLQLKP